MANGRNKLRDYYYSYIDNDIFFKIDVGSREELQQMEIEEGGEVGALINWDKWDMVVQRTKEQLEAAKEIMKPKKEEQKAGKSIYVYSLITKELITTFPSATTAAETYQTSPANILFHARRHKPYQDRIYFSLEELDTVPTADEIIKWIYAFRLDNNELLGRFRTAVEASKYFGLHSTQVGNLLIKQNGISPKHNLRFSYDKNSRPII